jgi:hypothetical protein
MVSKERVESMAPSHKTRDLARSLIACEVDASTAPQTKAATVRVYERLRQQLSGPIGFDGFQSLASRALVLAKLQSLKLSPVHIIASGELLGLGEVESQTGSDLDAGDQAGVTFIAQLLGLFLTFLGETTTLRLIEDLRLQVDVERVSATTTEKKTASRAAALATPVIFESLLREIDRLRSVSDHIEALIAKHSDMEEGLTSVVGNIRNLATVLDVFTLIRSKAGGMQDDMSLPPTNGYMN